jgi:hypothetical protein
MANKNPRVLSLLRLQWLATDEIRPSADFCWDALLSGELHVHALCEQLGSLGHKSAHDQVILGWGDGEGEGGKRTLGSMNSGTPKSTAFRRIT